MCEGRVSPSPIKCWAEPPLLEQSFEMEEPDNSPSQVPCICRRVVWFKFEVFKKYFLQLCPISKYVPVGKSREDTIVIHVKLAFEKFLTCS